MKTQIKLTEAQRKVRQILAPIVKDIVREQSEMRYFKFKGTASFKRDVNDRWLERNLWGDMGGDNGDISDFKIYDDGEFYGTVGTYNRRIKTTDDFINLANDIILNHDSNTNDVLETIDVYKK